MSDHATVNPIIEAWEKNPEWQTGFIRHLLGTLNVRGLKEVVDDAYWRAEMKEALRKRLKV